MQKITKHAIVLFIISSLIFTSCDVLLKTATDYLEQEKPLTANEVALGLKEALKVGTDSTTFRLSQLNGYYLDEAIKINLPPETNQVIEKAQKIPGLDQLIEDVVAQINYSAEDAAKQAAPIFKSAITSMSITDAWNILNGADSAATNYLKQETYDQLFALYQPIMQQSLNKPLLGEVSAQNTWTEVTDKWNQFANSIPGKMLGLVPLNTKLDEHVTHQALAGLFVKVADEEKQIRTDANARVTDLLQRVFAKAN